MANEYKIVSEQVEVLRDGPSSARIMSEQVEVLRNGPSSARMMSLQIEVLRTITVSSARRRQIPLG